MLADDVVDVAARLTKLQQHGFCHVSFTEHFAGQQGKGRLKAILSAPAPASDPTASSEMATHRLKLYTNYHYITPSRGTA